MGSNGNALAKEPGRIVMDRSNLVAEPGLADARQAGSLEDQAKPPKRRVLKRYRREGAGRKPE
jgi:hypothetical protein